MRHLPERSLVWTEYTHQTLPHADRKSETFIFRWISEENSTKSCKKIKWLLKVTTLISKKILLTLTTWDGIGIPTPSSDQEKYFLLKKPKLHNIICKLSKYELLTPSELWERAVWIFSSWTRVYTARQVYSTVAKPENSSSFKTTSNWETYSTVYTL